MISGCPGSGSVAISERSSSVSEPRRTGFERLLFLLPSCVTLNRLLNLSGLSRTATQRLDANIK